MAKKVTRDQLAVALRRMVHTFAPAGCPRCEYINGELARKCYICGTAIGEAHKVLNAYSIEKGAREYFKGRA